MTVFVKSAKMLARILRECLHSNSSGTHFFLKLWPGPLLRTLSFSNGCFLFRNLPATGGGGDSKSPLGSSLLFLPSCVPFLLHAYTQLEISCHYQTMPLIIPLCCQSPADPGVTPSFLVEARCHSTQRHSYPNSGWSQCPGRWCIQHLGVSVPWHLRSTLLVGRTTQG